jgi:hypothetical protein
MAHISTYACHKILDFLLGRESFTVPNTYFLALSSTPLGADGAGLTEPVGMGYSRLAIQNNKSGFSIANNKVVSIINEFIFAEATQPWGRMTHFALLDNQNNIWFYGALQQSIDVEIESSPILNPNVTSFTFDINGGSTTDMAITTNAANRILNHILGNSPVLSIPSIFYMGLSSTPISVEGVGFTEPAAPEYQRLVLPNDKNTFTVASGKTIHLAKEFKFETAAIAWGNYTHWFISETPTGENIWWSGKLNHSRNVEIATTLIIKQQGLTWTLGL